MNFRNLILFTIAILLLASCSPQVRLHRLITKHTELTRVDTIKFIDTVITKQTKIDTVFHSELLHDTITITKEKLQIRLRKINDTIYLNAKVEPDTIIITKEIPVQKIVHIEPVKWWLRYWWIWLLLLGIVLVLVVRV